MVVCSCTVCSYAHTLRLPSDECTGTDTEHGATRRPFSYCQSSSPRYEAPYMPTRPYAMPGTEIAHAAIALRAPCAIRRTELAYAGCASTKIAYAAMRCAVLRWRMWGVAVPMG
eukprot:1753602-Rhodomonas_salina.1